MLRSFTQHTCLVIILLFPSAVLAAEADFQITEDFLRICDSSADLNALNAKFEADGFIKADRDIKDAVTPDDFLTNVKKVKAWDITYPEGYGWFGVTASGKLGNAKVVHCGIMAIDDDVDGYRQDFDLAKEAVSEQIAKNEIETRYMLNLDDAVYVMREIRSPEISYFVYTKNTPLAAKEK
ncbi:hypothetical protein [Litorimonas sp. WD9-15]|uniref:hypothetical protein n=1 Tax=Litorimonas sp. WD9-15 TaxID=3418716 RepID=UPI003CFF9FA5